MTLAENILSLPAGSPRADPPHPGGSHRSERSLSRPIGVSKRTTCPPGGGKGGAMPVNQLTGDAPVSVDGITIDAPGLSGEVVVETGAGADPAGCGRPGAGPDPAGVRRHGGRARRTIRIKSPSDADGCHPGEHGDSRSPRRLAGRRRRTILDADRVPGPRLGRAQVLLSRDEHGIDNLAPADGANRRDISPGASQLFEVDAGAVRAGTRGFGLQSPSGDQLSPR